MTFGYRLFQFFPRTHQNVCRDNAWSQRHLIFNSSPSTGVRILFYDQKIEVTILIRAVAYCRPEQHNGIRIPSPYQFLDVVLENLFTVY